MPYLEITNLTRHYAGHATAALDGVSLEVAAGELFALLGPSGSGKSTLLKLIAGIERPDRGSVRLDGGDLLRVPAHKRSAVLMFQRPYLFPFLSVAENVGFGLTLRRTEQATIRAEVEQMLELVELGGFGTRRPAQLSGGEQQRVALARALITRPRLLMLDEPLSSLDPEVRQSLQEAIRRIQRDVKLTTLLVTHDLAEAVSMADTLAILSGGRRVALGSPAQIFERPPNRTAARFVGVSAFLCGLLEHGRLYSAAGVLNTCAEGARRETTFAIRPEAMRLHAEPGLNRLAGRLLSVSYRGDSSEAQVQVGELLLRVRQRSLGLGADGTLVYVELPAEDLFEVADV